MTVYVDEIRTYSREEIKGSARRWGTEWCHMFSDNEDKSELHEIAKRIGHKKGWFQEQHSRKGTILGVPAHLHSHYDLVPTRRELALKNGAVEGSFSDLIRKVMHDDEPQE